MINLREEVRSELQSFYERILTLIECSSAHPALSQPPPPPPPPSYYSPPQAEKKADTPDGTAHAPAADPPTNMVSFF